MNDKATKLDIFVYPPPERAYPHVSQHQGGKGGITLNDLDEMFVMTACHELYHAMSYKRTLDAGTEPKADDYGFAALRAYRRGGK